MSFATSCWPGTHDEGPVYNTGPSYSALCRAFYAAGGPAECPVPAGVREGSKIRLTGKGEPGRNGGPAGDLYVVTHVQESPVFERKGDNVEVEVALTLPEALRGAEIEVPTLDGRKTLRVPAGTRPGSIQRLRGEGPKRLGKAGRGDIRYRFVLDMPEKLTAEQEAAVDEMAKVFNGNPRSRLFAS
jgi:molecular chaperone DnaJ